MSINSAMQAGVSGLVANSSALAAISDNISNVNTVGYKRNDTSFETVVTGASGIGQYNAGGVLASTRQLVNQQGLLAQTSSPTDLGIQGPGFFVTADKATGLTASDSRIFTRAGSFQVSSLGYLTNSAGYYLQGWPVDSQGNVSPDPSDLNRLTSINIGSIGGTADPTTQANISANLQATQPLSAAATAAGAVPPGAGAYDPATNNMASYDPTAGTGVKPDYSIQIPVSDSKGGQRTLAIDFLRAAAPNQWYAEIRAVPASDVTVAAPFVNGQVATGIVAFTATGQLDPANTTLFGPVPAPPAAAPSPVITLGPSAGPAGANGQWDPSLGVGGQSVTINLGSPGNLTQLSSPSATQSIIANGTAFGNLTNIQVDQDGNVTANFDNGVTRRIAQVALATFVNPDGLSSVSGNGYRTSLASGTYNLKPPGSSGAGLLSPSTLESSTVDLSSEFTGLIVTQRAYSASSKIITTADQMLQELISIIR